MDRCREISRDAVCPDVSKTTSRGARVLERLLLIVFGMAPLAWEASIRKVHTSRRVVPMSIWNDSLQSGQLSSVPSTAFSCYPLSSLIRSVMDAVALSSDFTMTSPISAVSASIRIRSSWITTRGGRSIPLSLNQAVRLRAIRS